MAKGEKKKMKKTGISKNTITMIAVIATVVILVGGLLAVIFFMPTCADPNEETVTAATYPTDANGNEYAVDAKGNKIENDEGVARDNNGKIVVDGVVEITNQGPLEVTKIEIENESGSFTVLSETPTETTTDAEGNESESTQQTVYTLVGFEDAQLQNGQAESIANQASNMATTRIIDIKGENLEDYGLDDPRAKVTTTFADGTVVKMDIGDDAPDSAGTYIKYTDGKEVYLTDVDLVNSFFFSPLDLLSLDITDSATTEENAEIESMTLSGSNFPKNVTIKPNDDETCGAFYKMTAPKEQFVNVIEGEDVTGGIRGLYATKVVYYHPSSDQLKKVGLNSPAAKIEAKYADVTYKLSATAADSDGNVYLCNHDTNIVYQIAASSVPWAESSYEALKYEYVAKPIQEKLSSIEVTADGKTYKFGIEKVTNTDDDGNEVTSYKITYGDEQLNESRFSTFFDNLTNVQHSGLAEDQKAQGKAVLTVKYNYNNGKESDTISYYQGENRKMLAVTNGASDCYVFETYTDKIIADVAKVASGGTVTAI